MVTAPSPSPSFTVTLMDDFLSVPSYSAVAGLTVMEIFPSPLLGSGLGFTPFRVISKSAVFTASSFSL